MPPIADPLANNAVHVLTASGEVGLWDIGQVQLYAELAQAMVGAVTVFT